MAKKRKSKIQKKRKASIPTPPVHFVPEEDFDDEGPIILDNGKEDEDETEDDEENPVDEGWE